MRRQKYRNSGFRQKLGQVVYSEITESLRHMNLSFQKAFLLLAILAVSCKTKTTRISSADINALNLKKGEIVLCGPPDKQFGSITFDISCPDTLKKNFNLAVALLHSFEYEEAEKIFAKIIETDPQCAMAYWGVAMSNFHPLWAPSGPAELKKGSAAIQIAKSIKEKTERESAYINAIGMYYTGFDKINDHNRCILFEKNMEKIYLNYPQDKEAAIFYALSLDAAADPADKSYVNQRKAGTILSAIYPGEPDHPGIVHYIIHTYDYPSLAEMALPAARKYASIAPASAHAQHMPSHIFTRLGLWNESIQSNLISTSAAKCYAENSGLKGHWDEELHGMDYLEYAYLQKGDNSQAKKLWDYLDSIQEVYPANFKVAYSFAAIPSRYLLENKRWKEAAVLQIHPANFPWNRFPLQSAIYHFARLLGSAHMGRLDSANAELGKLESIHDTLMNQKDLYKANQVAIQIKSSRAWILLAKGQTSQALDLMKAAAEMEDATEKSPVTPGEVIPARELLGDMLMQQKDYSKALEAYQADLKTHPNRFNALYGAGLAAQSLGDTKNADVYYRQLTAISVPNSPRAEIKRARLN